MRISMLAAGAVFSLSAAALAQDQAQDRALVANAGFLATPLADCETDLRYLNQVGGWQVGWPREWQAIAAGGDVDAAVARWADAPDALAQTETALRNGLEAAQSAPKPVVARVAQQVRDLANAIEARDPKYFRADEGGEAWN
ncbi:MAG: hypothetical protein ACX939_13960, partial [Hyphococcus sp.]